ncbi:MAG: DUF3854 domain-containing protein [Chloroflexota bacterium]|nr:DUF3854 domain-containing protein [Chloroflexota bacterium]
MVRQGFHDNPVISAGVISSREVSDLIEMHLDHLIVGSGITIEVIRERGYRSILARKELEDLGFTKGQSRIPGLLIPMWGVDGQRVGYQYRPDNPREKNGGKPIKYESRSGAPNRLDCHPRCRRMLEDPRVPVWVTEGCKKADALASAGQCAIDVSGVWNWKGKNTLGGKTILADFDYVAWDGREIYLAFDSDMGTNLFVGKAARRLGEHLKLKGGKVLMVQLPNGVNGEKTGVDDYLVQGHTIDELKSLAIPFEQLEEEEVRVVMAPFFYDDTLYLEVARTNGDYAFAYLKDSGEIGLVTEVVTSRNIIRPLPLPRKNGKTIHLVGLPDENLVYLKHLTQVELIEEIRMHIDTYVDLPESQRDICLYYILMTWFYLKLNTLPYLRFKADTGKGKSRMQKVIGDLCFYPLYASGASSFSGIARQGDLWRGTLVIDESDWEGEKASQFIKHLNLGLERGKYYVLSDKQDPGKQEFFDPFYPKVMAMRECFRDNATEGRLISISPHETSDRSIPIILPHTYEKETKRLRNLIAGYVLRHWDDVDGAKMMHFDDLEIEPRLKQLAMPLSIIFQIWPEGIGKFRGYLEERQEEIRKHRSLSWDGIVVNTVISIALGDEWPEEEEKEIQAVTPGMVARLVNSSAKAVTRALVGVGFEVERRRITVEKKGESIRKQIRGYVVRDLKTWREIISRYYCQEDDSGSDTELQTRSSKEISKKVPEILCSSRFSMGEEPSRLLEERFLDPQESMRWQEL